MTLPFLTPIEETTPMPVWLIPTYAGVITASVFIPTKFLRVGLVLPVAVGLLSMVPKYSWPDFALQYLTMIPVLGLMMQWLDFVVVNGPEKDFYRKAEGQTDEDAKVQGSMPTSFFSKLLWSTSLFTTTRGIGWNWRVKNAPAPQTHLSKK
jgi:hypothetical protein